MERKIDGENLTLLKIEKNNIGTFTLYQENLLHGSIARGGTTLPNIKSITIEYEKPDTTIRRRYSLTPMTRNKS